MWTFGAEPSILAFCATAPPPLHWLQWFTRTIVHKTALNFRLRRHETHRVVSGGQRCVDLKITGKSASRQVLLLFLSSSIDMYWFSFSITPPTGNGTRKGVFLYATCSFRQLGWLQHIAVLEHIIGSTKQKQWIPSHLHLRTRVLKWSLMAGDIDWNRNVQRRNSRGGKRSLKLGYLRKDIRVEMRPEK